MTLASLRKELRAEANPEQARVAQSFFKTGPGQYGEGDRFLGIRVPVLRTFVRTYQDLPLADVEKLLQSRWHEERLVALLLLVRRYERGDDATRDAVYALYFRRMAFINNWDFVPGGAAPTVHGVAMSPVECGDGESPLSYLRAVRAQRSESCDSPSQHSRQRVSAAMRVASPRRFQPRVTSPGCRPDAASRHSRSAEIQPPLLRVRTWRRSGACLA